jgi:hypothetical protein
MLRYCRRHLLINPIRTERQRNQQPNVERKGVEPSTSALRTHEVTTELPIFYEVFVGVELGRTAGRTELTSVIRLIAAAD